MAFFIVGMGSNVSVINAEDAKVDEADESFAFESEEDKVESQNIAFETGNTVWQMSPVTWGLSMILVGLVSFMFSAIYEALMPVSIPIINSPTLNPNRSTNSLEIDVSRRFFK